MPSEKGVLKPHYSPGVRPVLKVTPNPRDILADYELTSAHMAGMSLLQRAQEAKTDGVAHEFCSVPVYYSFPPINDPFANCKTPASRASLLVGETDVDPSEVIIDLGDGLLGRAVGGLCMVLPSLIIVEPLRLDARASVVGIELCQIRIPVEHITHCTLHTDGGVEVGRGGVGGGSGVPVAGANEKMEAGEDAETQTQTQTQANGDAHTGAGTDALRREASVAPCSRCLRIEWDSNDAVGSRFVVITDQGQGTR
jgi:hypothetical protein